MLVSLSWEFSAPAGTRTSMKVYGCEPLLLLYRFLVVLNRVRQNFALHVSKVIIRYHFKSKRIGTVRVSHMKPNQIIYPGSVNFSATCTIQVICHTGLPKDKKRADEIFHAVKERYGDLIHVSVALFVRKSVRCGAAQCGAACCEEASNRMLLTFPRGKRVVGRRKRGDNLADDDKQPRDSSGGGSTFAVGVCHVFV